MSYWIPHVEAVTDGAPVGDQVLDKLADLLLGAYQILDILNTEHSAISAPHVTDLIPSVELVYHEVEEMMKRLSA